MDNARLEVRTVSWPRRWHVQLMDLPGGHKQRGTSVSATGIIYETQVTSCSSSDGTEAFSMVLYVTHAFQHCSYGQSMCMTTRGVVDQEPDGVAAEA
jgi:hypothetical protein